MDGTQSKGKLTERHGFYCIELESNVLVKLREGKEVVENAIKQLDDQAKAEQIAEIESEVSHASEA